jgi:chromate reductase, NAD(P)H dehydrogenase (quinone)
MTKIAVLAGSVRADSLNKKLAEEIERLAPADTEFVRLEIAELPLFSQDLENDVPASVAKLRADIKAADGVLLVTPEYNRSITGVMKNAIDWASRPYGDSAWEGKPVGIVGASAAQWGSVAAQQHLRTVMVYLNTHVLGAPEIYSGVYNPLYDENGALTDDWTDRLTKYAAAFTAHIQKLS